ncbi:Hypothetical predicted protein, partial [Mytilus galloprovincialis]
MTLQTDGFILLNQTERHGLQDVCINDLFSFDFMTRRNSGLLVHLESDNRKQHQFAVTFEDGDLVFTYRVNNKIKSSIIPYDGTDMVTKWNDNRWHKLVVERILDKGEYLSVTVRVDEKIQRYDSVIDVKEHVLGSNYVYLGKAPYADVKNVIYLNCFCEKIHLKIGEDRKEINKCCQEINEINKVTKAYCRVLRRIKRSSCGRPLVAKIEGDGFCSSGGSGSSGGFGYYTSYGFSKSVAASLEGPYTCHVNAKYIFFETGACCKCKTTFYGNGIRCLKTGKRLILRGKVYGVLNNKSIENVDLLYYVYTTNGRIETHIRSKQNIIRTMMKILQPIGDIIGWMFAVPQGKKTKNGFMMTGGKLNRTALIKYVSGETVFITQKLFTSPSDFIVQTHVQGTVPDQLDSISFNDFAEQLIGVSRVDVQTGNEETQIDESLTLFSPNVEENVTMNTISPTAVNPKEFYSTEDEELSGEI